MPGLCQGLGGSAAAPLLPLPFTAPLDTAALSAFIPEIKRRDSAFRPCGGREEGVPQPVPQ